MYLASMARNVHKGCKQSFLCNIIIVAVARYRELHCNAPLGMMLRGVGRDQNVTSPSVTMTLFRTLGHDVTGSGEGSKCNITICHHDIILNQNSLEKSPYAVRQTTVVW